VVISATQVGQKPSLKKPPKKSILRINWKGKQNGEREKKSSWNDLGSPISATNFVEENKKCFASYSLRPVSPDQYRVPPEMFDMMAICGSGSVHSLASSSNNVSNSSLRDVENGVVEDEATAYMKELR
jgi:hypothetical protein